MFKTIKEYLKTVKNLTDSIVFSSSENFVNLYSKLIVTVFGEEKLIDEAEKFLFLSKFSFLSHPIQTQINYYFSLGGKNYYDILSDFHNYYYSRNRNYSYLEIGTCDYRSLLIAKGAINVGVDPHPETAFRFNLDDNLQFRLNVATSDAFFRTYEDSNRNYNLIFIDGLHTFEQAAKDLVNSISKISHCDTDILLHDVIPINKFVANPDRKTLFWTGDVYKLLYLLKKLNLKFQIILAPPSGLLWIKGNQKEKLSEYFSTTNNLNLVIQEIHEKYNLEKFKTQGFLNEFSDHIINYNKTLLSAKSGMGKPIQTLV